MTAISETSWASALLELLQRQQALYENLRDLGGQQTRLIESADTEQLLALLARRQQLIDQLTRLNQQLQPYKRDWTNCWASLDPPSRQRVSALIQRVGALVDQIMKADEADRVRLTHQRDEIADGLTRMNRGASVHRAYGQAGPGAGHNRFTDQEG
jgi:flagellar biosynthesis/type III secretory pathway chaperone